MATTAFHTDTSRMMMEQAAPELAKGNSLQASEKGWGAASHAVKAIAEARGWRHNSHRDLFGIARRLANETGQPEILDLFNTASALHTNFYEGWLDDDVIAQNLARVRRLIAMLDAVPR